MNFLLFLAPFSWGTQKREASAPKASGCFMGGTCAVREEPGKQKPRSCRAQELARSSAQEMSGRKRGPIELDESGRDEGIGRVRIRGKRVVSTVRQSWHGRRNPSALWRMITYMYAHMR